MFARKIHVEVLEPVESGRKSDGSRPCPLSWLDSFAMRSFTGRSAFDDTLPVADGWLEAGSRVDLASLQSDMESWLTRKFGGGHAVKLRLTELQKGVASRK
ncbi:MAG TPA: hypothetical protein VG204_14085 [Terriglobia bacterium]|nr:hypothetical protein [Terriglobia bacterium]